jgi:hypothetical protein
LEENGVKTREVYLLHCPIAPAGVGGDVGVGAYQLSTTGSGDLWHDLLGLAAAHHEPPAAPPEALVECVQVSEQLCAPVVARTAQQRRVQDVQSGDPIGCGAR